MSGRKAVFLHSEQLERFPYPASCPFNTSRASGVCKLAGSMGLLSGANVKLIEPKPAQRPVLKKFHTARYLNALKAADTGRYQADALRMGIGTGDCPVFSGMYSYSELACGATVLGAEMILEGKADVAYNPSGGLHHAMEERASGFCYMNDVALGCQVLAEAGKKVLYLDVDVHFGDGVAQFFYERSDVMTISMHEGGRTLFPGTGFVNEIGEGAGKGYCVCVPLPVGTYDSAYQRVFNAVVVPLVEAFAPDAVVFQMGADALAGDPLAHLCLTNNTYVEIINLLLRLGVPVLMAGGGGYNVENTVRAWTLGWAVLCGADVPAANIGTGAVMLESTDRLGQLCDKELTVSNQQRGVVEPRIAAVIESIKSAVFAIHGL